jgi:radical SAM protein with 4Fe4S-binding SPASM domain
MNAGLYDAMGMARRMSSRKVVNAASMWMSFHRSRLAKRPLLSGLPVTLGVEPTTACNLRCPECPSGMRSFTRPTGMMPTDLYKEIVDQLSPTLSWLTLYFQGEPYLNPAFHDMIRYASDHHIYTSTSTNAHYLDDETAQNTVRSGLDRLIISIDGTTQETYESYRVGGQLQKVLEGATKISEWKARLKSRSPYVIFQFLVVRQNEHQVPEVQALARKIGVDHVALKTAQVNDFVNGSPLIPTSEKYSRYKQNPDGTFALKNQMLNKCWKMWQGSVITWDGKVVPCCFDKDASHVMGDLRVDSFESIWFGERYRHFREQLLRERSTIDICRNCTEGTRIFAD